MSFVPTFFRSLLTLVLVTSLAAAADWPEWRGPDANLALPAGDYPTDISPTKNVAWRIDLPGPGSSTPVVGGDAIYVTCEIDGRDALCCYSRGGEERWRKTFGAGVQGKHRNATGANPSPVTDGRHVFAYFKSGRLVAVSTTGDEAWRRELQQDYGDCTLWWDLGASPVLTEQGVLITVMQNDDPYLATFDPATGETVWKHDRNPPAPGESAQSYTTPTLANTPAGKRIIAWGADHVTGHDPQTGKELFRCGGFNPQGATNWRSIASATVDGTTAIVPWGRGDFVSAVRIDRDGDVSQLWTAEGVGSDVPCPVLHAGKAYLLGDRGTIHCLDMATGEQRWTTRLPRGRQKYFASPLLLGDVLYLFREDGLAITAKVGDSGAEVLAQNEFGATIVANPVPLDGDSLLVRTREQLYLFRSP